MALVEHVRTAARVLLGLFLGAAGVLHLTVARTEFRAQVPDWFPVEADLTVVASGVVEVVLGLAVLLLPRHRRLLGGLVALLFLAVFPGNLAQYLEGTDAFGLDTDRARLVRLFFQPLLIAWALWAGGPLRRRTAPEEPGTSTVKAERSVPDGRVE